MGVYMSCVGVYLPCIHIVEPTRSLSLAPPLLSIPTHATGASPLFVSTPLSIAPIYLPPLTNMAS